MSSNPYEEGLCWLRACSLVVADNTGQGLELGDLRIVFATRKGDAETPNSAEIRIYNLSAETCQRMRREFTRIVLQAGYRGNCGLIFDGSIRQARLGRDNGTDSWLDIVAADGDRAYNFATVNTTLAAGSTPADRVRVCQDALATKGTGTGHVADLGGATLPRGKVMYGMARTHLRETADSTASTWSIQDGKLQLIKKAGYLPGEAVVLTHETGLVGTPEQTNDGITVRCLINPALRVGGRIRLDNRSILAARTDLRAAATCPPRLDQDGFYRILKVEFSGDTRGNDWYASMTCVGIDDTSKLPLDVHSGQTRTT